MLYSLSQAGDNMTAQRRKSDHSSEGGTKVSDTVGCEQETGGGEPQGGVKMEDESNLQMKKEIGLFSGMAFIVGSIIGGYFQLT